MKAAIIGYLVVLIFILSGWVMNILTTIEHSNDPINVMMILRFIGIIVAPLGAILGWFF